MGNSEAEFRAICLQVVVFLKEAKGDFDTELLQVHVQN